MKKFDRIKRHFEDRKSLYKGLAIGAAVGTGATLGTCYILSPKTSVSPIQTAMVIGKDNTVNQVVINFAERSTKSKPIHLVGTDRYFPSIGEAARAMGLDKSRISRHLHGASSNVGGHVFEFMDVV